MKAIWTPIVYVKKSWHKRTLAKDLGVLIPLGDGGYLAIDMLKGFRSDGCSRPSIFWWFIRRWGSEKEQICYLVHDALFTYREFSLPFVNDILEKMLIGVAGYSDKKAKAVRIAVDSFIAKKAYEEQDDDDIANEALIKIEWKPSDRRMW